MRKLLITILFLCSLMRAEALDSYISASMTVTNIPTNGMTISVNGHVWTWTNTVTSANTQIATTNSAVNSATNLWVAFVVSPASIPNIRVQMTNTNSIVLTSQSTASPALTIATNGGAGAPSWIFFSYHTNFLTNETVVRVPTNGLGIVEQSNVANGLFQFLNSPYMPLPVNSLLPQWSNFVNATALAGLSNYVGLIATNGTNFALSIGLNSTNYASNLFDFSTNYANTNLLAFSNNWVKPGFTSLSNQIGALVNNVNYHDLGNLTGNTNSILLTNEGGIYRMLAAADSGTLGGAFTFYESDGTTVWMKDSLQSDGYFYLYDERSFGASARLQIERSDLLTGRTWLRGPSGNDSLVIGQSDVVQLWRPPAFDVAVWPALPIGTTTNFVTDGTNSGSGETAVHDFSTPANVFTNVGDRLIRDIGVTFTTSGTFEVKVYLFGDTIYDSGSFTAGASSAFTVNCSATVDQFTSGVTGNIRYRCNAIGSLVTNAIPVTVNKATSINFGTTLDCKVGLTGPASANIKVITDTVEFAPSPAWAVLP